VVHHLGFKDLDERTIIEQWLRGKRGGQKVVLHVPKRGMKRDLVRMASENAAVMLNTLQVQWQADTNRQTEALTQLQEALGLQTPPGRIECFDVSTLQGTDTVGSMVVFTKGTPSKGEYRRFSIKGKGARGEPDDYASMREMLRRRLRRAVEEALDDPARAGRKSDASWRLLPDLLIVDGGKGQLGVAVEVLAEYELTEVVPVVGLANSGRAFPDQPIRSYRRPVRPLSFSASVMKRIVLRSHTIARSAVSAPWLLS
jgi:excinuclease ABC subunit C